jgi:preprotein translocase subunit SecG
MIDTFYYITMALFITVCIFMILIVLIQKGRGGGLASAFGGAGGNTAFGSKTGDVLTWATSVVFGVFLVLAVALNLLADARVDKSTLPAVATKKQQPPNRVPQPADSGVVPLPSPEPGLREAVTVENPNTPIDAQLTAPEGAAAAAAAAPTTAPAPATQPTTQP